MRRMIEIDGKPCEFKSSAAIPRMYRMKFGRDIFVDMNQLRKQIEMQKRIAEAEKKKAEEEGKAFDEEEFKSDLPISSLEMFENIAYLMHKHGDPEQPKDIDEWLEQFEIFDIYQIFPQMLEMWNLENQRNSVPKKKNGTSTGK